jgi:hypothetical protein
MACATAPAHAATAKFDCDTAAKRFSQMSLPIAGEHVRIGGIISAPMIRDDDEWIPKLSLDVTGDGQQHGGFSISKQPNQSWNVELTFSGKESTPVATLARFEPIPFTLDVNSSTGTVDLTLGSKQFHGSGSAFQAQHLMLSCSTGNFVFDQLSWDVLPN